MALDKVGLGDLKLNSVTEKLSREQAFVRMESGKIDLMWLNTNKELESRFIPIRIPMYKGLMSYRVLMIRQGNEARFTNIQGFDDFKNIKAGLGRFWTTTKIFKAEGINSVLTTKPNNLYYMLEGGRFDYIPRGVIEITPEFDKYADLPLSMQNDLLLYLPTAVYPYVSRKNPELAAKLAEGMRMLIDSGEFDSYFKTTQIYKEALNLISQNRWKVIHINNSILPKETPLSDDSLWVSFGQYLQ